MVFYAVAVTVYSTLFGSFLLLITLLPIWFAFGRTHFAIRVPAFLLGSAALGLVLVFDQELIIYLAGIACVGFGLVRSNVVVQAMSMLFGVALLLGLVFHVDATQLDSAWIMRTTMAATVVAGMLASLRLFGFTLMNLTGGVTRLELDQGTGRDLDQWIAELDSIGAASLSHAEIMTHLRQYGFSYEWQRMLTLAYERTIGRWVVASATHGRRRLVVAERPGGESDLAVAAPQFTLRQILVLTFGAACFLGFARKIGWYVPTVLDLRYGVPGSLSLGAITMALVWGCLSVRQSRRKFGQALLIALVTCAAALGFIPANPAVLFWFWSVVAAFIVMLVMTLTLVRQRGYRLVRLQPARPCAAATQDASRRVPNPAEHRRDLVY